MSSKANHMPEAVPDYIFDLPEGLLGSLKPRATYNPNEEVTERRQGSQSALISDTSEVLKSSGQHSLDSPQIGDTQTDSPIQPMSNMGGSSSEPVDDESVSHLVPHLRRYNAKLSAIKSAETIFKKIDMRAFVNLLHQYQIPHEESATASSDSETSDDETVSHEKMIGDDVYADQDMDLVDRLLHAQFPLGLGVMHDQLQDQQHRSQYIQRRLASRSPIVWFDSVQTDEASDGEEQRRQIGIYKIILASDPIATSGEEMLSALRSQQIRPGRIIPSEHSEHPRWILLMLGGGHFAAAVFSLVPSYTNSSKKAGQKSKLTRQAVILKHKTFHRYTTRRKQGGSQAANDNAKGNAKSVGAQMRREGQRKLTEEIRTLLSSWSDDISKSQLIFWRATSAENRSILFDKDSGSLDRNDPRIRSFPFPTARATLEELHRSFELLVKPQVTHYSSEELLAREKADAEALTRALDVQAPVQIPAEQRIQTSKVQAPIKSAAVVQQEAAWQKLFEMIKKDRCESMRLFIEREREKLIQQPDIAILQEGVNTRIPRGLADERNCATLLHLASKYDSVDCLAVLLDADADPTTPCIDRSEEATQNVAFDLCSKKESRNVFRRAMAKRPDRWAWNMAHVPSPLTPEMEAQIAAKEAVRQQQEAKRMEALRLTEEAEDRQAEEQRLALLAKSQKSSSKTSSGPQRLGGSARGSTSVSELAGLSADAKLRFERERRARAAEERLKRLAPS